MPSISALALLLTAHARPPHELYDYLAKPDPSYQWTEKYDPDFQALELTSQTWQGSPWRHTVLYNTALRPVKKGLAVLFIGGDGPSAGDRLLLRAITDKSNLPCATLSNIPNQPLYDQKEDGLIAYTFDRYLTTGDSTWPLLFSMAKAALRAMDAITEATRKSDNPITQFIVSGGSKRGWTTWMVGAAKDPRVVAIAPMVIDNLNLGAQMKHQLDSWGSYSLQIQDYTKLGLQAKFATGPGKHLAEIVDPYSYRSNARVPTLIVKGANDPYWTVDALNLYWNDLRQPKWVVTVPNAGHGLGDKLEAIETLGGFAQAIAGAYPMPRQRWSFRPKGDDLEVTTETDRLPVEGLTLWVAEADNLDFRASKYHEAVKLPLASLTGHQKLRFTYHRNVTRNEAMFLETRYGIGGISFRLCSPTQVFRKLRR
jgi:PhoPQ-activated pathogenicity-related protein